MNRRTKSRPSDGERRDAARPARSVPETTNAEAAFFARMAEQRTPLAFKLRDGEILRGVVEWQDRSALRVALDGGRHVVLQKLAMATVQRQEDEAAQA